MTDGKKTAKQIIKRLIWSIVKATLLSLVFYIIFFNLFTILLYTDVEPEDRDPALLYCLFVVFYGAIFYLVHIRKYRDEYRVERDEASFVWISDLRSYFQNEGKYLALIYGIMVVVMELSMLIFQNGNPIGTVMLMVFPLMGAIKLPIIRMVVSFVVTMLVAVVITLWEHKRMFDYWNRPQK